MPSLFLFIQGQNSHPAVSLNMLKIALQSVKSPGFFVTEGGNLSSQNSSSSTRLVMGLNVFLLAMFFVAHFSPR